MKLIAPHTIAFTASVTEEEIRERMAAEVLEQIGALDDAGKPLPGIKVAVYRSAGRKGGYIITVASPAPARLALPRV